MNRRARAPATCRTRDWQAANFASRTMRWTGVIVGLFVLFHLADLTWGTANPDFVRGDVYRNFVATFSRPPVADHLPHRQRGAGHPPVPRHLVAVPEPRAQQPEVERVASQRSRSGSPRSSPVVNVMFPISVLTGVVDADDNPDCSTRGDVIVSCAEYEEEAPSDRLPRQPRPRRSDRRASGPSTSST